MSSWVTRAACHDMDRSTFFSVRGANTRSYELARATCAVCPVLKQCRAESDASEVNSPLQMFGFVGGESPNERYLRRRGQAPREQKMSPVWH